MADIDLITDSFKALDDKLCELHTFLDLCHELAAADCPDWLFLVSRRIGEVQALTEAYARAVNQHAMPVLRDFAKLSRSTGLTPLPIREAA